MLVLALILIPALPVHAIDSASSSESCAVINELKPGTDCGEQEAKSTLGGLIGRAVEILSFVVGFAAILMIVYGGLKYVTSGGDATKTKNAQSTIIYALVGLVVAVLAQVIVNVLTNTAA